MPPLEQPPAGEDDRIANIVRLTIEQINEAIADGWAEIR